MCGMIKGITLELGREWNKKDVCLIWSDTWACIGREGDSFSYWLGHWCQNHNIDTIVAILFVFPWSSIKAFHYRMPQGWDPRATSEGRGDCLVGKDWNWNVQVWRSHYGNPRSPRVFQRHSFAPYWPSHSRKLHQGMSK